MNSEENGIENRIYSFIDSSFSLFVLACQASQPTSLNSQPAGVWLNTNIWKASSSKQPKFWFCIRQSSINFYLPFADN
ncbi:hypothetical protein BLOT_001203 [Blomia tropicalis]|nr:hypothetical protein BLOT_001203 [Blomia tropicalis]